MKEYKIAGVAPGSIAQEMGLDAGDCLLSISGQGVRGILDYRWLTAEEYLVVEARKPGGEIWELEIEKDSDEDLGLIFEPGTMGEDKRCKNACIFCFVDQQPPGLRETLYVKDDDPFQSFAVGNYITLTNLDEDEIEQIVKYKLSPMRISVHAGDMELRKMMMKNPGAGKLYGVLERFKEAGIEMHFQVVLCKGINDGVQLDNTISRLVGLGDAACSLAVVPVGLTGYRQGLYPLTAFGPEDAAAVITQLETWQARLLEEHGRRFVYASDEWYVLAGCKLPTYEKYDDFPQLDNGVGMMTLFEEEFLDALGCSKDFVISGRQVAAPTNPCKPGISAVGAATCRPQTRNNDNPAPIKIGIVTGRAAGEFMGKLAKRFTQSYPGAIVDIYIIENKFFGPGVTVSGLITGADIIAQLQGRCDGVAALFIPENAFRAGTDDMLCGATLKSVSAALGVEAVKGASDGGEFCHQLLACLRAG